MIVGIRFRSRVTNVASKTATTTNLSSVTTLSHRRTGPSSPIANEWLARAQSD